MALFRRDALQVLVLVDIGTLTSMTDLANTDNALARDLQNPSVKGKARFENPDLLFLQEGSDIGNVFSEDRCFRAENLFHSIETAT